jgi:predicted KAP-like P-loop ATPase
MSSREIINAKDGVKNKMIYDHIGFRDPVVHKVVRKFIDRSDTGYNKYGRTLNEERVEGYKNLLGYVNDIQEELMDAILYIQTAKDELADMIESCEMFCEQDKEDDCETCDCEEEEKC